MAESIHFARISALQQKLRDNNISALCVSDLVNIRYLCGFTGTYGMMIIDAEKATFVTDGRYGEIAGGIVKGAEIKIRPLTGIEDFFQGLFKAGAYEIVGFEGTLSYNEYEQLKKYLRPSKSKLLKAPPFVQQLRRVKDKSEIATIAKAAKVADKMMSAAWDAVEAGVSEIEIGKVIRRAAEDNGASGESFPCIVASGPNASRPHHRPQTRKIKNGDMITIDLGAVVDGYCSDLTRNPVLRKAHAKFEEIYSVCLQAQEAALAACTAGISARELDAVARDVIDSKGFGQYYNHGLGHGVGIEIHEAPRIAKSSEDVLEENNVVTIEPGIYLPGFGGVRIEDLVVVTKGKPRVLSHAPKALEILGS